VRRGPPAAHLDQVELLAPVLPTKIVGIGLNYRAHAAEMGKKLPDEPLMFLKPPSAVLDPGRPIVRPAGYARVDFEGELAVVFGRAARHVPARDALSYVAGYTCMNDVTVRDLQVKDVQYTRAKGFDTFAPLGPCLVSGLDPSDLKIITRVDGTVRQSSSTADLIFSVPALIEAVTRVMTMLPGDIISTGTPPGVGQIEPGTTVEIEVEGIGVLRNPVVAEEAAAAR
jgi:2-keto-4-pentenoate hydratase/2-oxohepta-3-ene-1,7-dioic acid hydratase in catechol pathway